MEKIRLIIETSLGFLTSYRRKYIISFQVYNASTWVPSNCAAVTFYNAGTSNAFIQQLKLEPKIQLKVEGNFGELDVTQYNISFDNSGTNLLYVIVKNYV